VADGYDKGRRRLLVVASAVTASACGSEDPTGPAPGTDAGRDAGRDAGAADTGAAVDAVVSDVPEDRDQPYLGLDGGVPTPMQEGWRPGMGGVDVGPVEAFAVGVWRYNAGARAVVGRDMRGFFAYSALCTHEQCVVNPPDAQGNCVCPCHGSRFDGQGRVTMRPATADLDPLAVAIVDGRVLVDPARMVARDVRVAPPADAGVDAGARPDVPADTGPVDAGPRDTGVDVDPCTMGSDVGPVTMFGVNTWRVVSARDMFGSASSVIVGRDAMGLFAMSTECTHEGCIIGAPTPTTGETECPCHSSRFDGNGAVLRGPARRPLPHFAVRVCAGRVRVEVGVTVAASDRARVM